MRANFRQQAYHSDMEYSCSVYVEREREGGHGWWVGKDCLPGHRLGPAVRSLVQIPVLKLKCSPFKKMQEEAGRGWGEECQYFHTEKP